MSPRYYTDEYASIGLDESIPCVILTLTGVPRHSEHYAMVQSKSLELVEQEHHNYRSLNMLTDSRKAGLVLDEDVNYFGEQIIPALEKAKLRSLAILLPDNRVAQLGALAVLKFTSQINIKFFTSTRKARHWLRKNSRL